MISALFATLIAFVVLDAAWIFLMALRLFREAVGGIMRPEPLLVPVVLFYGIYAFGLTFLAVRPALAASSAGTAAANGALLGLVAYGTFDLTNLAILGSWTPTLAAVDMSWGVVASAISALVGYAVCQRKVA